MFLRGANAWLEQRKLISATHNDMLFKGQVHACGKASVLQKTRACMLKILWCISDSARREALESRVVFVEISTSGLYVCQNARLYSRAAVIRGWHSSDQPNL